MNGVLGRWRTWRVRFISVWIKLHSNHGANGQLRMSQSSTFFS